MPTLPSSAPNLLIHIRPTRFFSPLRPFCVATNLAARPFATPILRRRQPFPKRPFGATVSRQLSDRPGRKMAAVQPPWSPPPIPNGGAAKLPKLKLWNSLTRSKVDFVPLKEGKVSWYSCTMSRQVVNTSVSY